MIAFRLPRLCLAAAAAALSAAALAASPWRVPVEFACTNDAGMGYSWFVVGSHPDVGSWNPADAVPLVWHEGNVWSASVGIQAGTELEYKFVRRSTAADRIGDPANADWEPGANRRLSVPAEPPAPSASKSVVFRCDWDEPVSLHYSVLTAPDYAATSSWASVRMSPSAPGRYVASVPDCVGEWIRFTVSGQSNGQTVWYRFYGTDDEDFFTPLDAFCVMDGQVFDYEPSAPLSDSRIFTQWIASSDPSVPSRDVRVYLPRGYDENSSRRYPVVFFSDGQNVFSPADFSSWDAEFAADREIRGGRMREAILVAVPCRSGSISGQDGRTVEYLPPQDSYFGARGRADAYADFLLRDVRATLTNAPLSLRMLSGPQNTAAIGSSSGGLLAAYLGVCTPDFGLVAAMSGVYNGEFCPNFRAAWQNASRRPSRLWLDTGTAETDIENLNLYESNFDAYAFALRSGLVPGADLVFAIGLGDVLGAHNEQAWAARLPSVYRFLLDVRSEFNPLLPLSISLASAPGGGFVASWPLYPGSSVSLRRADSLFSLSAAAECLSSAGSGRPWAYFSCTNSAPEAGFYFLRQSPGEN